MCCMGEFEDEVLGLVIRLRVRIRAKMNCTVIIYVWLELVSDFILRIRL